MSSHISITSLLAAVLAAGSCFAASVAAVLHGASSLPATAVLPVSTDSLLYAAPYLQDMQAGSIDVLFQTRRPAATWVEAGPDTTRLRRFRTLVDGQQAVHDEAHRIHLSGLTPGRRYVYRVCAVELLENRAYHKAFGDTLRTPFRSFSLPGPDDEDFTAVIVNDLHMSAKVMAAFAAQLDTMCYDFVIFNGDCLPEPSSRADAMRMIAACTAMARSDEHPTWFVRGNHEIRNAYSSGMHTLLGYPGGRTYGAFSWGDTRFVMLDCGEDKPDSTWVYYGLNDFTALRREQAHFLKAERRSRAFRRAGCRVLIHHIPLWLNTDKYRPCSELWLPIVSNMAFDVDLCAHVHRFGYLEAGREGNPFPVVRGGGPGMKDATMLLLVRRGKRLTLYVRNTAGATVRTIAL